MSHSGCAVTHRPGTQALRGARVLSDPLRCGVHNSALRDQSGFEIAPERDHQFARQCHNSDASDASLGLADALGEPLAQSAVRLVADPQPGDLDSKPACAGIAGLADALINAHRATVVGAWRQAKIAGQFAAIVKVTIEYFPTQRDAADLSNAFQAHQCRGLGTTALCCTSFFRGALRRRYGFDCACLRAFDVLIWRSARISRSCSRASACLVCAGNGPPVPVIKPSRRCTKSRRCGLTPRIPKAIKIPPMRLVWAVFSFTSTARSRGSRLASSSVGVGT